MSTGCVNEQDFGKHVERQMGCMAGFLQLFDRHQIMTGKCLQSAKRLSSPDVDSTTSESQMSAPLSHAISRELGKPKQPYSPSPERPTQSPRAELRSPLAAVGELPLKSPLHLPLFEMKEGVSSSRKFCKEAPRLSLDSRANTDAKGGLHPKEIRAGASTNGCEGVASDTTAETPQQRSPSVIVRLMGLEALPESNSSEPEKRRSTSDSRVSRDLFHFIADRSNFSSKQTTQSQSAFFNDVERDNQPLTAHYADPRNYFLRNANKVEPPKVSYGVSFNSSSPWRAPQHRKSFFDSGDFFPEPKQTVCGETENRFKMSGINGQSKDLETLKPILEALQFKGLLHSRKPSEQNRVRHRNIIFDGSPNVATKPSGLLTSAPVSRRTGNDHSPPNVRNQCHGLRSRNFGITGENSYSVSCRRELNRRSPSVTARSPSLTTRSEVHAGEKRSNSPAKPKPLCVETKMRTTVSTENRRLLPVSSSKLNPRRTGPDPTVNNRSSGNKKATAGIHQKEKIMTVIAAGDESSSISGSSITTLTYSERTKSEEYKEGRNLLERCDKLLHSIAEMTATDMQPSPVSVLDSSFYRDESATPSPATTRRSIDFKDHSGELEDETWSPVISPIWPKSEDKSDDSDFAYVSDILRASHYFPEDSDIFLLLEKQQHVKGKGISGASRQQRKLIFDTVNEILDSNRQLPPWNVRMNYNGTKPSLDKVWSEFQRIRDHDFAEDLFETICGVLKKDLGGDASTGWGDWPVEMSEAILGIERLIFKELISETIRDLAALVSRSTLSTMMPRRKLVFT